MVNPLVISLCDVSTTEKKLIVSTVNRLLFRSSSMNLEEIFLVPTITEKTKSLTASSLCDVSTIEKESTANRLLFLSSPMNLKNFPTLMLIKEKTISLMTSWLCDVSTI